MFKTCNRKLYLLSYKYWRKDKEVDYNYKFIEWLIYLKRNIENECK